MTDLLPGETQEDRDEYLRSLIEKKYQADELLVRQSIYCTEHRMRDCSPLLNGCSRVNKAHDALDRILGLVK